MTTTAAFDKLARQYDRLWTCSPVGQLQREAVWRHADALFPSGSSALDLGCGTGVDARHLMQKGLRVRAIDVSAEMVSIARARGVNAETLPIEQCGRIEGPFDAVLSNFGALNCVVDLKALCEPLARLVRPGGHLALCIIGRFCLWETAWALLRRKPAKAFRRWRASSLSSLGFRVFYPSQRQMEQAFRARFNLVSWRGIGLAVPPSYVAGLQEETLRKLDAFDRRMAHLPGLRGFSDHRLFIFTRNSAC